MAIPGSGRIRAPTSFGAFRVLRELGAGGMATVYRVAGPDSVLALKVFRPDVALAPDFPARFLREAEIGLRVRHENVVRTLDMGFVQSDEGRLPFLLMEYVEGRTLRTLLDELVIVPEGLCRHIGREIALGLQAIHAAGAVHRDLKPENILITPRHTLKIMDLGVARLLEPQRETSHAGIFVGSILYAAPEQFSGIDPDGRADLYALGLILYELATGHHPYRGRSFEEVLQLRQTREVRPAAELNPRLTAFFEEVLAALLARDRDARPADVARILADGETSPWWRQRAATIRARTRRPLRRPRLPRETAFHGRDAELARLRRAYRDAAAGRGQVVLVEGEPGIGKTRLVDEFVRDLAQSGESFHFLTGAYPPNGAAMTAGALSTAFREHLGPAGLEEALRQYVTSPVLVPAFAAVLTGVPLPPPARGLSPQWLRSVFADTLRGLAAERPTILCADDLHDAPPEARRLFTALAQSTRDHRVLVVGAARPGLPADWIDELARTTRVTRLSLSPLEPDALAGLLRDALRSTEAAEALLPAVQAKAAGNPLFACEILRDLEETGALVRRDDGVRVLTRVVAKVRVPATVREVIRRRIVALPPADRALLDVAACCGFRFDPALVARALESELIPTMQRLGRLERAHHLVRAVGRRFVFEHQLVHETLLDQLDPVLRRTYHAALGHGLEENGPVGDSAYDLCAHFLAGGLPERALAWLGEALDHLEANYLHEDAIRLMDRVLATPGLMAGAPRVDLLVRKAVRLNLVGRVEDERRVLHEALREVRPLADPTRRARVLIELGWHLRGVCRYREARHALRGARHAAREAGDVQLEARAAGMLGSVCFELGRLGPARRCHERRRELCRRIGDRRGEASATGNLGIVLWALGRSAESEALFRRQLELSARIGDRQGEAAATGNLGNVFHARGDMAAARRYSERYLALCSEIGNRLGEVYATGNLGNVCFGEGRFEEALARHRRAAELSAELGNTAAEAVATDNLGADCAALGRYREAERHHRRALELARAIGDRLGEARACHNLGVVQSTLGRARAADGNLRRAAQLAHAKGARPLEVASVRALAALAARAGRWDEAEQRYAAALGIAESIDRDSEQAAAAHLALGDFLAETHRPDQALVHLRAAYTRAREKNLAMVRALAAARLAMLGDLDAAEAEAALRETGGRLEHRWELRARGLLWRATGDPRHRDAARRLLDALVAEAPAECRTALVEQDDMYRALRA